MARHCILGTSMLRFGITNRWNRAALTLSYIKPLTTDAVPTLYSVVSRTPCYRYYSPATSTPLVIDTPFQAGDFVVLRDCLHGKVKIIGPLTAGTKRDTRSGIIQDDNIIGQLNRSYIFNHRQRRFIVSYPTLEDYVELRKRHCSPIYHKDASTIVTLLDLAPGSRVLEAGTGAGALTMHLARAVGIQLPNPTPTFLTHNPSDHQTVNQDHDIATLRWGQVDTVETRPDHFQKAQRWVQQFQRGHLLPWIRWYQGSLSEWLNHLTKESTATATTSSVKIYDGVVLDLPTPWYYLLEVAPFLKPGRFLVCYLPNMSQVLDLLKHINNNPALRCQFATENVLEVAWKRWQVKPTLVRNPVVAPSPDGNQEPTTDVPLGPEHSPVNSVVEANPPEQAWVCHPDRMPLGHTAFLVRLRNIISHDTLSSSESSTVD
ncbi:hypothetical protein IWQ62_002278 [Dispira parvispora]|uniref:tRNA (adenine(58)-N(1))-methyltransferase catalytic subunit TRM61 n=1 Tax=Dispira parvispora TaxID=1520584 RepID=A0A9W8AT34_9FUNG|nr:hypothetical protein IWQ62_002278 [Dispira parvispora]